MDHGTDEHKRISELLKFLCDQDVISEAQFILGFRRVYSELSDLKLDVPNADKLLSWYVSEGKSKGYLPSSYSPDISDEGSSFGHVETPRNDTEAELKVTDVE